MFPHLRATSLSPPPASPSPPPSPPPSPRVYEGSPPLADSVMSVPFSEHGGEEHPFSTPVAVWPLHVFTVVAECGRDGGHMSLESFWRFKRAALAGLSFLRQEDASDAFVFRCNNFGQPAPIRQDSFISIEPVSEEVDVGNSHIKQLMWEVMRFEEYGDRVVVDATAAALHCGEYLTELSKLGAPTRTAWYWYMYTSAEGICIFTTVLHPRTVQECMQRINMRGAFNGIALVDTLFGSY